MEGLAHGRRQDSHRSGRGPTADRSALQQKHVDALLRQVIEGGRAGDPPTDDHDIGL